MKSSFSGFYKLSPQERLAAVVKETGISEEDAKKIAEPSLPVELADKMVENVIGTYTLPMGVALNFIINGKDVIIPMVTEEPSVIAAASNSAKMARMTGGFTTSFTGPIMIAQVQIVDVPAPEFAKSAILQHKEDIKTLFAEAIRNYQIDLALLNGLDMSKSIAEVMTYYQNKVMPSDSTMALIHLMAALLLVHPSSVGCTQKFEAARDALSKDHTAYEEVLIDVVDAVKAAASKAGINSIDDLKKLAALKDLASLITKEDLLKIAQSIYDLPDLEAQIQQYMDEHSGEDAGKTEDRIASLEAQINDLTAIIEKLTQEAEKKKSTLAKAKIKTVKPAKKALTVKWKAVANASGYQVYYKASGKKAVIKTVKGAKKLTLKLTGLKKKAKYTVKVRAYKTASGKTTYGKWSAAKKAKTK